MRNGWARPDGPDHRRRWPVRPGRRGRAASRSGRQLAFIDDLAAGTFVVECLSRDELRTARDVVERYRDLKLGIAEASLVVLAQRYASTRILTFDERAFRVVTPLQGGSFTVLPADLGTATGAARR